MTTRQLRLGCTALLCTMVLALIGCSREHNRLQALVTNCLDTSGETYCTSCPSPRTERGCISDDACSRTMLVWRETMNYVAIRDRKMCGCSNPSFIHGLAIPRALISGVDAPNRPNGIWSFAWETALGQNIPKRDIALAINPKHDRSENQMHIHITRLREDARGRIAPEFSARVNSLESVWSVAGTIAATRGLSDYGVLVTAGRDGDFEVVVDGGSPEDHYMVARCPQK